MSQLEEILDRLESLMNALLQEEMDEAFLDQFQVGWQASLGQLEQASSDSSLSPTTRAHCKQRLQQLLANLPQAEDRLNQDLSETSRLLYQENQRASTLGKSQIQKSGRFMYRKA
ncbi:MAG: hypothetical protein G8345_14540 [Magnetococcales bacterium]|nr:hypothetical protein [Magnetococcales bacterium]NGZ28094.1 hypothetical protein [Magnetococcales bacterium]